MFRNREIVVALASLLLFVSLLGQLTAYDYPLTSVDARLRNYLDQEQKAWTDFPKSNATESMQTVFYTHAFNLDFYQAQLDVVMEYSDELAQNVTEMNRTANRVLELLRKNSYSELRDLADIAIRTIPQKITKIFAEVKRQSFKKYLSEVITMWRFVSVWRLLETDRGFLSCSIPIRVKRGP